MSRPRPSRWFTSAIVGVSLAAHSACSAPAPSPEVPRETAPRSTLEQLLPLQDRTVSSFRTTTDLGETGLLVLEFYRPRPGAAQIEIAGRVQRLHVRSDAVEHATGGFWLKEPLAVGQSFPGSFGVVRIESTDATVSVPAGQFSGCLNTVETSENPPKRVATSFCPRVGVTRMVVEANGDTDVLRLEAELQSHGPRVELGASQDP